MRTRCQPPHPLKTTFIFFQKKGQTAFSSFRSRPGIEFYTAEQVNDRDQRLYRNIDYQTADYCIQQSKDEGYDDRKIPSLKKTISN